MRGLLLPLLLLPWLLAGCARPEPEERLRETLQALQVSLEGRSSDGVREILADDFVGPGGLDRAGAAQLARVLLMRHRSVGITFGPFEVELQDQHATVEFTAALTGGSGRLLPDAARVYTLQTGWREHEGQWRMTSARWTPQL